jgi:hypothetical protein
VCWTSYAVSNFLRAGCWCQDSIPRESYGSFLKRPHAGHFTSSRPSGVSNPGSSRRSCIPALTLVVFQPTDHDRPHTMTTFNEGPSLCSSLHQSFSASRPCTEPIQDPSALKNRYYYAVTMSLRYFTVAYSASGYQSRAIKRRLPRGKRRRTCLWGFKKPNTGTAHLTKHVFFHPAWSLQIP